MSKTNSDGLDIEDNCKFLRFNRIDKVTVNLDIQLAVVYAAGYRIHVIENELGKPENRMRNRGILKQEILG